MTTRVAPQTVAIPASHLDLLTRPICGVLTTMGGDGQPQSSLVWVDVDPNGVCARVNTTLERQKGRNLVANPRVSLLLVDPDNPARYLQVRGDAELVTDGALAHLDALTRKYTRHPAYYGHIYPVAQQARETRVICRIHAGGSPWTPSTPEPRAKEEVTDRRPARAVNACAGWAASSVAGCLPGRVGGSRRRYRGGHPPTTRLYHQVTYPMPGTPSEASWCRWMPCVRPNRLAGRSSLPLR